MNESLKTILTQTSGVVTRKEMEDFVAKEITDALVPLIAHKNSVTKLGWLLLTLVIGDLAARIFGLFK